MLSVSATQELKESAQVRPRACSSEAAALRINKAQEFRDPGGRVPELLRAYGNRDCLAAGPLSISRLLSNRAVAPAVIGKQ